MKKLLVGFLLFMVGCGDSHKSISELPKSSGTAVSQAGVVTYQDVRPIFVARCVGCHLQVGRPDWSVFQNAFEHRQDIRNFVSTGNMPRPPVKLVGNEREMILAWVDQGGLKDAAEAAQARPASPLPEQVPSLPSVANTPPSSTQPQPDPSQNETAQDIPLNLPVTFEGLIKPYILDKRCSICHNAATAAAPDSKTPDWSKLETVLAHRETMILYVKTGVMPMGMPMPSAERYLLISWLESQAPSPKQP